MGDRGHVEDGVVVHWCVESGVIAEGPLGARLARLDISLDHEITAGRHLKRLGDALHQLHGFLAGESGKEDLIDPVGKRCRGSQCEGWIATEADGDGHLLSSLVVALAVSCADLVHLPMHACGGTVIDLDAIHADVALPGVGILGVDRRQGDKAASVLRPAFQDREMIE